MIGRAFFTLMMVGTFGGVAAAAPGSVVDRGTLTTPDRVALEVAVSLDRVRAPEAYDRLDALRSRAVEMDQNRRGRLAPMGRIFQALGTDGLLPMLEALALESPSRDGLTDTAWTSVRCGMLEAVGALRDARAEPVLIAALTSGTTEFEVVRSASEALGKLRSDRAVGVLTRLASEAGPRQFAVLQGMGTCRRVACTQAIASALLAENDLTRARALVRSLSDSGNAWAWNTPSLRDDAQGDAVRGLAMKGLIEAFVRFDGDLRRIASNALLVVDHRDTDALLAAIAAGDDENLIADIATARKRLARNPARVR